MTAVAGDDEEDARLRERIEALRAENQQLRGELARARPAPAAGRRRGGRAVAASLALVLGALLVVPAVVASWARGVVTDTDRYLATVAPLADDPAVQRAVIARATGAITDAVRLDDRVGRLVDAVAGLDVPPAVATTAQALRAPLVGAAEGVVHDAVESVVVSDAFGDVWREANRVAHAQLVGVLEGDPDAVAALDADGTLSVPLGPVVEVVRDRLVERGFTLAEALPAVDVGYPLLVSADLVRVQQAYRLLDVLAPVLVWVTLALLSAGVLLSRDRPRAVVVAGGLLVAGGVALGLGLTVGRGLYLDAVVDLVRRPDAALAVYDHVVATLRVSGRVAVVLGALAVLAGAVTGRSTAAVALRRRLRTGASATLGGRTPGSARVVDAVARGRTVLVATVLVAGALALALRDRLTPGYVAAVGLGCLLLVAAVRVVASAAGPTGSRTGPQGGR